MTPRHTARAAALVLLSLWLPFAAQAREPVWEEAVVRNRLHSVEGRLEASLALGFMPVTRLTAQYPLVGSAAWNLFETLAVEVRGGVAWTRHTGLARSIAAKFLERDPNLITTVDELSDAWELRAHLMGGVRWQPLYGKVSLLTELPVHFQGYLWAGAGTGLFHRQSLVDCREVTGDWGSGDVACGRWFEEDRVGLLGSVALGARFFTHTNGAVRLEARVYGFADRYRSGIDRLENLAGGETGERVSSPGITPLVTLEAGYTFIF